MSNSTGDGCSCVHCGDSFNSPVEMTCEHPLCYDCAEDIKKRNKKANSEEFHCPTCNTGVIHQGKNKNKRKNDSGQDDEEQTKYKENKAEIYKNLEDLEHENEQMDELLRKLNVIGEKTKVNAVQMKNTIIKDCDALILIVERRKKVMMGKVDKAQQDKLRALQTQMRTCQKSSSKDRAVIVRTNRDLERLPQITLNSRVEIINKSIDDARESHPELTPCEDEKIRYKLDTASAKEQCEQLDLEEVEDEEEEGEEEEDGDKKEEENKGEGENKEKEENKEEGVNEDGEKNKLEDGEGETGEADGGEEREEGANGSDERTTGVVEGNKEKEGNVHEEKEDKVEEKQEVEEGEKEKDDDGSKLKKGAKVNKKGRAAKTTNKKRKAMTTGRSGGKK